MDGEKVNRILSKKVIIKETVRQVKWGDRGVGVWESRGRERYGRRERKGRKGEI